MIDNQPMEQPSITVFISYSGKDRAFVNAFAGMLNTFNLNVWKDQSNIGIGDLIRPSIQAGIKAASHFCCIISSSSIVSAWVEEELTLARDRQLNEKSLRIVPVLIENVAIPDYLTDYLCAHLEDQNLSIKNPEFIKILRAFGIDLQGFHREILSGTERAAVLVACITLNDAIIEFRDALEQFKNAMTAYDQAVANPSYDQPYLQPAGEPLSLTTYESDARIADALDRAGSILRRLRIDARSVSGAIEQFHVAWTDADPKHGVLRLAKVYYDLSPASSMCATIGAANEDPLENWWVDKELGGWIQSLPRAEASVGGAIDLLGSWARFDPKALQ
jgi:hypothetical protein